MTNPYLQSIIPPFMIKIPPQQEKEIAVCVYIYMAVCIFECSQSRPRGTLCNLVRKLAGTSPRQTLCVRRVLAPCAYLVRTLCVLVRDLVREPAFGTSHLTLVRALPAGHKVRHKALKKANCHMFL